MSKAQNIYTMKTSLPTLACLLLLSLTLSQGLSQSSIVKDLRPGSEGLDVVWAAQGNKGILFLSQDVDFDCFLAATDGTEQGTQWMDCTQPWSRSKLIAVVDGRIIFEVSDPTIQQYVVYSSEGEAGVAPVELYRDTISNPAKWVIPDQEALVNGKTVVFARANGFPPRILVTDGTPLGTSKNGIIDYVYDRILPESITVHALDSSWALNVARNQNDNSVVLQELWQIRENTDPELIRTLTLAKNPSTSLETYQTSNFLIQIIKTPVPGAKLFEGYALSFPINQLGDTSRIALIDTSAQPLRFDRLHVNGDSLIFIQRTVPENNLWSLDETGLTQVSSLNTPENLPVVFTQDVLVNDHLYYTELIPSPFPAHSSNQFGRIMSYGLKTGKVDTLFETINPHRNPLRPFHITAFQDKAILIAQTMREDVEIWVSDGSTEGTKVLDVLWPGLGSGVYIKNSGAQNFESRNGVFNDQFYFAASAPGVGVELARTDGTSQGTFFISEGVSGNGSGDPEYLFQIGEQLVYLAFDIDHGREWRTIPLTAQKITPQQPAGYNWVEVIGDRAFSSSAYTLVYGLSTNQNGTSVLATTSRIPTFIYYQENNQIAIPDYSSPTFSFSRVAVLSQFDRNGRLNWYQSVILPVSLFETSTSINDNNETYWAFTWYGDGQLDSAQTFKGDGGTLIKLDSVGNIMWNLPLSPEIHIQEITSNENGVWVTGSIFGDSFQAGSFQLSDIESNTQKLLIHVSNEGQVKWMIPYPSDQDVANLVLDDEQDVLYCLTKSFTDTTSPCFKTSLLLHLVALQASSGDTIWSRAIHTGNENLFSRPARLSLTNNGDILLTSSGNGDIKSGELVLSPGDCAEYPFVMRFDGSGKPFSGFILKEDASVALNIFTDEEGGYYWLRSQINQARSQPIGFVPHIYGDNYYTLMIDQIDEWDHLVARQSFNYNVNSLNTSSGGEFAFQSNQLLLALEGSNQPDTLFTVSTSSFNNPSTLLLSLDISDLPAVEGKPRLSHTPVSGWSIGPNPVDDFLYLYPSVESNQPLSYQVYSITGALVMSGELADMGRRGRIDFSNISPGMYLMRIEFAQESETLKLIVR